MKYPTSFIVWWLGLTLLYLALQYVSGFSPLTSFVGLFVPFGIFNVMVAVSALQQMHVGAILSITLFFLALFGADWSTKKLGISSPMLKIGFNLVLLLALTFIVDYSIYGEWNSWKILMGWNPFSDL